MSTLDGKSIGLHIYDSHRLNRAMEYTFPWMRHAHGPPQVRLPGLLGQAGIRPQALPDSGPRISANPFGVRVRGGPFGAFLTDIGRGSGGHVGAVGSEIAGDSRIGDTLIEHPRVSLPTHLLPPGAPAPTRNRKRKLKNISNDEACKRRADMSGVGRYTRGDRARAAACNVDEAVKRMRDKEAAPSANKVKASKLKTWDLLASKIGVRGFSEAGVIKVLRLLSFAGYRSSASYADLAVQRFVKSGGKVSDAFRVRLKAAKRAAKRGLGPPKQGEVFPLSNFFRSEESTQGGALVSSGEEWVSEPEAPFGQERLAVVASWWMLREIEIASLKVCDVVQHTGGILGLRFEVQKNDCEGTGETIFLQCICGDEPVKYCPTCNLHTQVSLVQRLLNNTARATECNAPLFPNMTGGVIEKRMVVKVIETVATRRGFQLKNAAGRKKYGGHFFRILGATWLCERGILRERIMALGRWRSNAIDRYLRNAPLKTVFSISREVRACETDERSGPCLKGVGCDAIPLKAPPERSAGGVHRESLGESARESSGAMGLCVKEVGCGDISLRLPLDGGAGSGRFSQPDLAHNRVTISLREVVKLSPKLTTPSEEAAQRVSGPMNPYILSTSRTGKIHMMAGEVMGPPLGWETKCGWRFGSQGPAAWVMVPTRSGAALCNKCFTSL